MPTHQAVRIKAMLGKSLLKNMPEVLQPSQIDEIRKGVPDAIKCFEDALTLTWMPIETLLTLQEQVMRVAQRSALRRLGRVATGDAVQSPMFAGLVKVGMTLFGVSTASLLRIVPRAAAMVYENAFNANVEVMEPERRAVVVYAGVAPEIISKEAFFVCLAGSLDAVISHAGSKGACENYVVDPNAKRATFNLQW